MAVTINTMTNVLQTAYAAANTVSREPSGIIDAATKNFDDKGVAYGDTLKIPVVPAKSARNFEPAATTPAASATTPTTVDIKIETMREVPWDLTGEEIRSLNNGGILPDISRQSLEQAMRTLRNEIETAAATALKVGASRAVGTAGTTPFAASLDDLVTVRKILRDNGAPMADAHFVGNSSTEANILKLSAIQQAYAAGSDEERRSGIIRPQFGFNIHTSAGIDEHTSGSAASYVTNGGEAAAATSITVGTGSDPILAGDIFSIADAGSYNYVVNTALTGAGELVINRPGLKQLAATAKALTFESDYTPNFAFERSALVIVARPPEFPVLEGRSVYRTIPVSDESGLTYLLVESQQWGKITWSVMIAYDCQVVQPEHVAILMG